MTNLVRIHFCLAALLASLCLIAPGASAQTQTQGPIKNIVLVHGAWADGSSWDRVIPLLLAKGFRVVSAQHPLSSIADDVAATNRIVDAQDGPVLLVGHSYGGAVITEAGNNAKVAGLVYIAAFAPDEGETLSGLAGRFPKPPVYDEVRPIADGYLLVTAKGINEDVAPDMSQAERDLLLATQGATQSAVLQTPITKAAWHSKPTWFVIAANDRVIAPEQETSTAKRMGAKTLTVKTSHVAMLVAPTEVANFIAEAANSLGSK